MQHHHNNGFSLIELMVVLAIVGILTAIAVPTYHHYIKRARYSEIVTGIAPYKLGVSLCYQTTGDLKNCSDGNTNIPHPINKANNAGQALISTLTVSKGIIKVTPKTVHGFTSKDTYTLTPTAADQHLSWKASGGAVEAGYAQ